MIPRATPEYNRRRFSRLSRLGPRVAPTSNSIAFGLEAPRVSHGAWAVGVVDDMVKGVAQAVVRADNWGVCRCAGGLPAAVSIVRWRTNRRGRLR